VVTGDHPLGSRLVTGDRGATPDDDVDVTTPAELADISAAIHDEYFDIERLEHDADRGELRLAIYPGRRKKWWFIETGRPPENPPPPPIGTLVVQNVLDVSVRDEADIGWYDVGRLEYEADAGELRIVSNVPCEIVIRCQELNVELVRN
jgi:hypothetical protein